ncbi:hypothetical protein ALC53_13424 [Atta colombica]|uniref:Uncharacterized protein n=1 Tax=Atta colombica TaxID=520822 RepID=A0A195AVA1_9HYME|nr:hypothetical protein ALC53_13424 [Atta colombica]
MLSSPFRKIHPEWNKISGCRQIISQAFLIRGIPATAMEAILASLTKSTITQYTKLLKLRWQLCRKKDIFCFFPPMRFFKGIAIIRPQRPHYNLIWDPSIISHLYPLGVFSTHSTKHASTSFAANKEVLI